MPLDRAAILAIQDLETEEIDVPEWGGSVIVRVMTGTERDRFEAEHLKDPQRDFFARIAVATLCDEVGTLIFTRADVEALGRKSAAALARVAQAALRINALTKADVDDLEKNSEASPSADSYSSSPPSCL